MFRRSLFPVAALAVVSTFLGMAGQASAQYSVYVYNTSRNSGWFRSGSSADVNKSYAVCKASIDRRIAENKRAGQDFEAFGISYGTAQNISQPQYVIYRPTTRTPPPKKLFYCEVRYTYQGRTYRGYLGGYSTEQVARQAYSNWRRSVINYRPELLRVFSQ